MLISASAARAVVWWQRPIRRHPGRGPPGRGIGPGLGQIQGAVDQRVTVPAGITEKHSDLAILDASPTGSSPAAEGPRPGVLPLHPDRLVPFLDKPSLVQDQH